MWSKGIDGRFLTLTHSQHFVLTALWRRKYKDLCVGDKLTRDSLSVWFPLEEFRAQFSAENVSEVRLVNAIL